MRARYDRINRWMLTHLTLVAVVWGLVTFATFASGGAPVAPALVGSTVIALVVRLYPWPQPSGIRER